MILEVQYPGDKYKNYDDNLKYMVQEKIRDYIKIDRPFRLFWISPNHVLVYADSTNQEPIVRCLNNTFCSGTVSIIKE